VKAGCVTATNTPPLGKAEVLLSRGDISIPTNHKICCLQVRKHYLHLNMLKRLLLALGICLCFGLKAQNLIQNCSFEEYNTCPMSQGGFPVNYLKHWYSPSKNTPDYFNTCSTDILCSVPDNYFGWQYPQDGNGYAGGGFYVSNSGQREYLTNHLLSPLQKNSVYCLSFYICSVDNDSYRAYIDKIGINFSNDSIWYNTFLNIPLPAQLETEEGYFYTDSINWQKVSLTYTATGGERYMTVGNFRDNANSDTILLGIPNGEIAYYYVDNFSLYECFEAQPIKPFIKLVTENKLSIYPNPSVNTATLQYEFLPSVLNPVIELFDNPGRVVYKSELNSVGTLEITTYSLSSGIYQLRVIDGKQIIWNTKLAVQH
jgi:hypothetical protein